MADYTKENMPDVDKLFKKLAENEYPSFLDVLAALSEIGDGSFDPEPICDGVRCQACQ